MSEPIRIITDDPITTGILDFPKYSASIAKLIENSKPRFTVGIFGGWGTGKTTLMAMIKNILDKNDKILTIWFDAWRYEREENLAVIPFLRTLKLKLDEMEQSKRGFWGRVGNGVIKTVNAYVTSTKVSYGIKDVISAETDFERATNSLKDKDTIGDDKKIIYYHATDFLENALNDVRSKDKSYRIVIFVDDLDRCSPDKALEVLESIKSLFDIEGMIYVIGMNYHSINNLVNKKYGGLSASSMSGFDYLKKVVQLPFLIPSWSDIDISSLIELAILKQLEGSRLVDEFRKHKDIIIKGVETNPREVKRFFNNIILANEVFNKPIETLIVIQALKFRVEWNNLLEVIMENKDEFLNAYEDFLNDKEDSKNKLMAMYPELEKNLPDFFMNSPLREFLKLSLPILKNTKDIQEYRRALESVSIDETKSPLVKKIRTISYTNDEYFKKILDNFRRAMDELGYEFERLEINSEQYNEIKAQLQVIINDFKIFIKNFKKQDFDKCRE